MEPFKNILVDIDATAPAHLALERAAGLARRSGATLTITDVMTVPSSARRYLPAALEEDFVSRRREHLSRLARAVTDVRTHAKLLMGRPATALIQEVLRSGHDLVVRSHARDLTVAGPRPFGAVDMELLRKCPCPVFLVQHGSLPTRPQIAGAVNASTEDASERALNGKIVELTLLMAELERGVPMLVQAWAPFAEHMVRSHSTDDAFAAYAESVRERTATDLRDLAQSFGGRLAGVQTIHQRGEPEDVIPEIVVAQGLDLVVMGTVARAGIAGFFIGNTAERILSKLPCSVLAVKPDGFECPVRLDTV